MNVLEIMQILKDAVILDVTIQGVSMGPVVGVGAAVAVVVEPGVLVQSVDGSISLSVCDGNYKVKIKTLAVALWKKEPVWQTKSALKLLKMELLALLQRLLGPVLKELEAWDIGDGQGGVPG